MFSFSTIYLTIFLFPTLICGECCYKRRLIYTVDPATPQDSDCRRIEHSSVVLPSFSLNRHLEIEKRDIEVCADGNVTEEMFCGIGFCDWLGCNCDQGCRSGDYIERFKERYPNCKFEKVAFSGDDYLISFNRY